MINFDRRYMEASDIVRSLIGDKSRMRSVEFDAQMRIYAARVIAYHA